MKSFDILKISERARSSKLNLPLYNATAGMFFADDGNLMTYDTVRKTLEKISTTTNFAYPPSIGNGKFLDGLKSFVFGFDENLKDEFASVLTLGGTGALSLISDHVKSKNIILPRLLWTNYFSIFHIEKQDASFYELFSKESLKNALSSSLHKNDEPILVINDPAQNPTGYSMSEKEYEDLVDVVNNFSKDKKITLILIIILASFSVLFTFSTNTCLMSLFNNSSIADKFNENVQIYYTFSASKTFGIYSLRTGCLLFKKNENLLKSFNKIARSTYSCPPTIGNEIIYEISSNHELLNKFKQELKNSRSILVKRGEIAIKTLDELKISHLPYHFGFYISLYIEKNAYDVCDELESKNCFLVPMDEHHIRVAICSLPTNKIEPALKLLKEVLNEK